MRDRITDADGPAPTPPIERTHLPRTPRRRARESRTPSTTGRVDPNGRAPSAPQKGPALLDPPRQGMARVAQRLDGRAARNRVAVASPMAASPLGRPLETDPPRPPQYR